MRLQARHLRIVLGLAFQRVLQIQHRHRQCPQRLACVRLRQHRHRGAVLQHVGQTILRIRRVQRHVSSACLQYPQQPDHQFDTSLRAQAHSGIRAHTQTDQRVRHTVGPCVQFRVAHPPAFVLHRDRFRRAANLGLEHGMQGFGWLRNRLSGVPNVDDLPPLFRAQQRQPADRTGRIGDDSIEQLHELRSHPLDRFVLEQHLLILEHDLQPVRQLHDVDRQVIRAEADGALLQPCLQRVELRQRQRAVEVEQHRRQRTPLAGAQVEIAQQVAERIVGMGMGFQHRALDPPQELGKRRVARAVAAHRDQVQRAADQAGLAALGTADHHRHADHHLRLPRQPLQQHGHARQHGHEQRAAQLAAELLQPRVAFAVDGQMVAPGPMARRGRPGMPARQLQRRRQAAELPAPIGAILLIPIAAQVGLMPLHLLAERARGRQPGRAAAAGRPVACGQLLQHDLLRIAIDDDVVEGDRQQVLGLALAQQAGADQRAVPGVHRPMVVVDEPLPDRRVAVGLPREIDHGQPDLHGRQHALMLAVGLDHAAQRGMPIDDLLQRAGQRRMIQRAAQTQHGGGVVAEGRLVADLALEPDAFLGRHQRIALGGTVVHRRRRLEGLLQKRELVEPAQDRVGVDAEIDEAADLIHADRLQPLHEGPARGRAADQRAVLHVALVRHRQQVVAVVLAERAHVRLQAQAVDHVLEQAHRRPQVVDKRRTGNGARLGGILADKGVQQHADTAALHAVAVLDQGLAVQREVALKRLDGLSHQVGEDARADLASAAVGIRIPHDGDPDRQLRLPGHREQLDLDLPGRTVPHPQGLAPPERLDLLDALEHQLAMAAERLRREHEVVRMPAGRAGDARPALREVVHHRPLFSDPHRMVQRQHDAARAQLDARCFARQRGAQHRRIGREPAERMEMPLRQPQRRKAAGVGIAGHLEEQPILLRIVAGRIVAEERDAEADAAPGRGRHRRGRQPGNGGLGHRGRHRCLG
ncbi:hypothetical protein GO279_04175 [Ralstonia solanacearum]|nr:hypothetical protein [Ralstonia solanacearum]NKA85667.1 hypothetical protein [Ralstonia solanacearum]NKF57076.1 hypothetical protein [Ralstonia solanacearum]NKF66876.1 hypothetical protein [Ralstonia solanacearum]NKF72214.1 hypothetical protein [Ralstonia solanacearum]